MSTYKELLAFLRELDTSVDTDDLEDTLREYQRANGVKPAVMERAIRAVLKKAPRILQPTLDEADEDYSAKFASSLKRGREVEQADAQVEEPAEEEEEEEEVQDEAEEDPKDPLQETRDYMLGLRLLCVPLNVQEQAFPMADFPNALRGEAQRAMPIAQRDPPTARGMIQRDLVRGWALDILVNVGSKTAADVAKHFLGSSADKVESSPMITVPRALWRLIRESHMYRLRWLVPQKDTVKEIVHHARNIARILEQDIAEREWWSQGPPTYTVSDQQQWPSLAWVLGEI